MQGTGEHPARDPWGKEFTATYCPDRHKVAGKTLAGGFCFILDGFQGDADFIAALFSLNSHCDELVPF